MFFTMTQEMPRLSKKHKTNKMRAAAVQGKKDQQKKPKSMPMINSKKWWSSSTSSTLFNDHYKLFILLFMSYTYLHIHQLQVLSRWKRNRWHNETLNNIFINHDFYQIINNFKDLDTFSAKILNILRIYIIAKILHQLCQQFEIILINVNKHIQLDQINIYLEMSSEDQNVLTHTKKLGNSQFLIYCKSLPETAHLIYNIQKYLSKYDSFYWNSILIINKGRTIPTLTKRLQQQYQNLINQKSFLHLIIKSLNSRQKCIQKIKRQLSKASTVLKIFKKVYFKHGSSSDSAYLDYVHEDGYTAVQVDQSIQNSIKLINQIFVDMARLRDMTIYIIQTVHIWKQQLQQWSDKCNQYKEVFFMNNKTNIYQTILKDTSFIWQSQLSGYVWMQYKMDPFFIRNVLQIQQKQQKEILQKYFIQILYPKNDQVVKKALKCFQLLSFKYQPKIQNLYAQQEQLIQSYLKLQRKQNDERGIKIANGDNDQRGEQKKLQRENNENKKAKNKVSKINQKGWVFGNLLQKPSRQRIQSIIQNHQHRISLIKPFNIANFPERKTLALAFIDNLKKQKLENVENKQVRIIKTNNSKRSAQNKKYIEYSDNQKGYKSQTQLNKTKFTKTKALDKFSQVIIEDPHEDHPETPKKTLSQVMTLQKTKQNKSNTNANANNHPELLNKIKLNSFFQSQKLKQIPSVTKNISLNATKNISLTEVQMKKNMVRSYSVNEMQKSMKSKQTKIENKQYRNLNNQQNSSLDKIDVENQETQLNFGKFLSSFRADTNKKMYKSQDQDRKKIKINQNQKKLSDVRQLIMAHRRKGGKSLVSLNKKSFSKQKLINAQLTLNLSPYIKSSFAKKQKQKTHNNSSILSGKQTNQYEQVFQNDILKKEVLPTEQSIRKFQIDQFIILKTKTIPIDTLPKYLRHIFSQEHSTSKKFTLYNLENLIKKMSDPCAHCLIFDIFTQKRGHIGQAILVQSFGTSQKLKYTLQFINVHVFQLIVATIMRIAQQLLVTTPCDQVVCPFYIDKLDPVSIHFVSLLEQSFKDKIKTFGQIHIYQKKGIYFDGSDIHQRLYIFSSKKKKKQTQITKKLMGNYRSLKFQCKCLLLTSNFRLRGKTVAKDVISNYNQTSIGQLYRRIFQKILTKYHLKQIRTATLNVSQDDQTVNTVKQNVFLRSLVQSLSNHLKESKEQKILITRFQSMEQVLTYLNYKQYSKQFYFAPFHQSRFILNHQLFLSEVQIQLSLQFMIKMSVNFIILYNNRDLIVQKIGSTQQIQSYLLPTTENDIKLLLMNGKQYNECSEKLDLFSYLFMFLHQHKNDLIQMNNIKQILIPNIKKSKTFMSGVKMFDGFFRLFPQRQFYSGSFMKMSNLWESYFPSAIIEKASQNAIYFEYPLIIGFYQESTKQILTAFLVNDETML